MERAQDAALAAASKSSKLHQTILVREAKKSLGGPGRLRDWVLGECVTQQQRAAVRATAAGVVAVEGKAAQEQEAAFATAAGALVAVLVEAGVQRSDDVASAPVTPVKEVVQALSQGVAW